MLIVDQQQKIVWDFIMDERHHFRGERDLFDTMLRRVARK